MKFDADTRTPVEWEVASCVLIDDSSMRILHVITSLQTGGAETLVVNLMPRFRALGHAVSLQQVTRENGKLSFNEVRRLYSVHPSLNVGMHTFNMYKGVFVTDALGFHNMWIRKFLRGIRLL